MRRILWPAVTSLLLSCALAGCAHPQAKTMATTVDVPLDVPAPPPRAVEPITADALPPLGPVNEPARNAARPRPAPAPAAAAAAPQANPPRVEAPAADAPKPSDDAAAKPAAAAPAPTLQTTSPQQEGEVEARIRGVLSRATNDLNRVDYGRLNTNLKSQYDSAKRFVSQAEENIRTRNLVFAEALADKAAELAAQLAGR